MVQGGAASTYQLFLSGQPSRTVHVFGVLPPDSVATIFSLPTLGGSRCSATSSAAATRCYEFEGSTADYSAQHLGIVSGEARFCTDRLNNPSSALCLGGASSLQYVTLSDTPLHTGDEFTIVMTVRVDWGPSNSASYAQTTSGNHSSNVTFGLFGFGEPADCGGADGDTAPSAWVDHGGDFRWSMCSLDGVAYGGTFPGPNASSGSDYSATPFFPDGVYVDVTLRKNHTNVEVFRDGESMGDAQLGPEIAAWADSYWLGRSGSNFLQGVIDTAMLFDHALTDSTMRSLCLRRTESSPRFLLHSAIVS